MAYPSLKIMHPLKRTQKFCMDHHRIKSRLQFSQEERFPLLHSMIPFHKTHPLLTHSRNRSGRLRAVSLRDWTEVGDWEEDFHFHLNYELVLVINV